VVVKVKADGGKELLFTQELLQKYIEERVKSARNKLLGALTVELRRAVEDQLRASHAQKNAKRAMRLEFRAAVNMFQRSKQEFACADPKCKLCQPKRQAQDNASGVGILKDSYYIRRQRGKGFDGANLLDRWGYQLQLVLVDQATGAVVSNSGTAKVELLVLKGDFEAADWSTDVFDKNVHHASTGSGELLKNATFSMQNGVAVVPDSFYVLQPSYNFKPRSFRLGARVLNLQGVKEAKTEPFAVKTGRSLSDEKKRAADHAGIEDVHELPVKKLPGIGRAAVDKLDQMGITNVEQFVERMNDDADDLRKTLKMSDRQWEEATSAAKRLVVEAAPPMMWFRDKSRSTGIMFDADHYPVALALPLEERRGQASGIAFEGKKFRMISALDGDMSPEHSKLLLTLQNEAYSDWYKAGHPNYIAMPRGAQSSLDALHVSSEGGGRKEVTEHAATAVREAQRTSQLATAGGAAASPQAGAAAGGIADYVPPLDALPPTASAFQRQASRPGVAAGLSSVASLQANMMLNHMSAGPTGTQDEDTLLKSLFPGLSEPMRQSTLEALRSRGLSFGGGGDAGGGTRGGGMGGMSLGLGAALQKDKERAPAAPASASAALPPAPLLFSGEGAPAVPTTAAPPMLGAVHQNSFMDMIPLDLTARQVSLDMLKVIGPTPIMGAAAGGEVPGDLSHWMGRSLEGDDKDEAAHLLGASVRQASVDAIAQLSGSLTRKRSARLAGIEPGGSDAKR